MDNVDFFYDALMEELATGPTFVKFTKKDGTDRTLLCTRNLDLIDQDDRPKGGGDIVDNIDQIRVWDYEDSGWKSFLYSNCISFTPSYVNSSFDD